MSSLKVVVSKENKNKREAQLDVLGVQHKILKFLEIQR